MGKAVIVLESDLEGVGQLGVRWPQATQKTNHELECICKNQHTEASNNFPLPRDFFFQTDQSHSGNKLSEKKLMERRIRPSR